MQMIKFKVFLAKLETVYGTDSTPVVGTDAIEVRSLKKSWIGEVLERDNIRGNISPIPSVVGKRYIEVAFDVELKGSGSAGTVPALSDLLQACGLSETISAGSSVVYAPLSSNQKSVTMYIYDLDNGSAVLSKITGAMGTVSLKAEAGKIVIASFAMRGLYSADPTNVALPSAPTYETTVPPIVTSAQFSFGGVSTLVAKDLSLDLANTIAEIDDISSASGIKAFLISGRKPKGSVSPEAVTVDVQNNVNLYLTSAQNALSVVIGSVAGNKITITAPKCVLESVKDGDDQGVLTADLSFMLGQNTGNDELSIKFA